MSCTGRAVFFLWYYRPHSCGRSLFYAVHIQQADCQVTETGLKVAAEVERSCAGEHRLSSWSHDLLRCCAGPVLHIHRMMYGGTAYLL